jgi:hypothetical protein
LSRDAGARCATLESRISGLFFAKHPTASVWQGLARTIQEPVRSLLHVRAAQISRDATLAGIVGERSAADE